ncbi:hypothetical protein [Chryseobacterium sp. 5_R23647]|uniref:hypothetical protein n=1 Tax=Chryseobacterium sp. 5_R23647 TaxID=2258964 RepID=UPI000E287139|nr:hypothetical protein [Chryseobacterium sp. 5_R23647]REC42307.1 hypothetical protein DRF69_12300 [Chryseobacterium sp. 5_R23647]
MNLLKKITFLSMISVISMMNAQSVHTILNKKESFRKDISFSIKADSKETYLPVTIIKGKQQDDIFRIVKNAQIILNDVGTSLVNKGERLF